MKFLKRFKVLSLVLTFAVTAVVSMSAMTVNAAPATVVPGTFPLYAYALLNPQTAIACNYDPVKMYNYYMTKGINEGQRLSTSPTYTAFENLARFVSANKSSYTNGKSSTFFDVQAYANANPLLKSLFGNNWSLYTDYYLNYGIFMGQSSGTTFDPAKAIVWTTSTGKCDFTNIASLKPETLMASYKAVTGTTSTVVRPEVVAPASDVVAIIEIGQDNQPSENTQPAEQSSNNSEDSAPEHVHSYGNGKWMPGGHTHRLYCSCGAYKVEQCEQYYFSIGDPDFHSYGCRGCDLREYNKRDSHIDGDGDGYCDRCGDQFDSTTCTHFIVALRKNYLSVDGYKHQYDCDHCHATAVNEDCSLQYSWLDDNKHKVTCSYCSRDDEEDCSDDGSGYCKCGRFMTSPEP